MSLFSWRRRNPIYGLIGACIALVPLIILGVRATLAAVPFILMQPSAMAACRGCDSAQLDGANPYRRGHVLVVNHSGMAFGLVMSDKELLEIVATAPGEVRTLVAVGDPIRIKTGIAGNGDELYRIYRDVCLIDWSTKQVIYRTSLAGSKPSIST